MEEEEVPRTAAARKVRRDLCAVQAIPERCLLCRVPPILQAVDDHVLFPFSPLWTSQRWVWFSDFEALRNLCAEFRDLLLDKTLMIFVMPYVSLGDAYNLHQLLINPGRIQLPAEGQHQAIYGRVGDLSLPDPDAPDDQSRATVLKFVVVNYGLLWGKASEHLMFIGSVKHTQEMVDKIKDHRHHLVKNLAILNSHLSEQCLPDLEDAREHKKLAFVLSLYRSGMDPHDAILAVDAQLHDQLYQPGYDPCYPSARTDPDFVEMTRRSVETYMTILENIGHLVLDVKQAAWAVLEAEGEYESAANKLDAIKQHNEALDTCQKELMAAVNKMNIAVRRPSFIGVLKRDSKSM